MSICLKKVDAENDPQTIARELVPRSASSGSFSRRAIKNRINRTYHFESAHYLPFVPDGHKCKNMHGHTYRVDIVIHGELDSRGFIKDFAEIDNQVLPLIIRRDRNYTGKEVSAEYDR